MESNNAIGPGFDQAYLTGYFEHAAFEMPEDQTVSMAFMPILDRYVSVDRIKD